VYGALLIFLAAPVLRIIASRTPLRAYLARSRSTSLAFAYRAFAARLYMHNAQTITRNARGRERHVMLLIISIDNRRRGGDRGDGWWRAIVASVVVAVAVAVISRSSAITQRISRSLARQRANARSSHHSYIDIAASLRALARIAAS